ncbi:hypothetical protein LTR56_022558 [Elasticomyces elasticus]|nr:hypothetical protein LTR56_022558 [Elasticomyces elasticus]KAK3624562.1 hypothetical protein LTR22_023927 [Elasticomyces elasticus]KAK4897254.1 hypothetical protein LTR49_028019 [Elasticomyces elasticus]KAK5732847.1 hypothetical protein LTS12_027047 [Elasticomyces elasticus]
MATTRIAYKADDHGNPMYARVSWSKKLRGPKLIALVYHGGGLLVGSSEMIPKVQTEYLCSKGFIVIAPNYRLVPQVSGKDAFADCVHAYDWATTELIEVMQKEHRIKLDPSQVVAMGHSSGGTAALHVASCRSLRAVTAFYPSLFLADTTTSAHKSTSAPPFGFAPHYTPTDEEYVTIEPASVQVSEFQLGGPGIVPQPRNKWQMHIIKHGEWLQKVQPDGDYASVDPLTRVSTEWPPVMIVQGELDDVPGSSLELAQRAELKLKDAGVKEVVFEIVPGEKHMFDMPPSVGGSDLGPKWEAVKRGLDWLVDHV